MDSLLAARLKRRTVRRDTKPATPNVHRNDAIMKLVRRGRTPSPTLRRSETETFDGPTTPRTSQDTCVQTFDAQPRQLERETCTRVDRPLINRPVIVSRMQQRVKARKGGDDWVTPQKAGSVSCTRVGRSLVNRPLATSRMQQRVEAKRGGDDWVTPQQAGLVKLPWMVAESSRYQGRLYFYNFDTDTSVWRVRRSQLSEAEVPVRSSSKQLEPPSALDYAAVEAARALWLFKKEKEAFLAQTGGL